MGGRQQLRQACGFEYLFIRVTFSLFFLHSLQFLPHVLKVVTEEATHDFVWCTAMLTYDCSPAAINDICWGRGGGEKGRREGAKFIPRLLITFAFVAIL